jgi:hypothetical protein
MSLGTLFTLEQPLLRFVSIGYILDNANKACQLTSIGK